jgi:hypothetical protein
LFAGTKKKVIFNLKFKKRKGIPVVVKKFKSFFPESLAFDFFHIVCKCFCKKKKKKENQNSLFVVILWKMFIQQE